MYRFQFHDRISDIPARHWNRLSVGAGPFLQHEFLMAMEESGCVSQATGWRPRHLAVYGTDTADDEMPCAVMPLYAKTNSYGEFVFDFAWAEAWHAHGLHYYPKLVTAPPFSPCMGPRLLHEASTSLPELLPSLTAAVTAEAATLGASSWHVLFPEAGLADGLQQAGLAERQGTQFHWFNRGYESFDDFLATFSSRKRKAVRKERQAVADEGLKFDWKSGSEISSEDLERFFAYYRNTYLERGRDAYLNLDFFVRLCEGMPEQLRFLFVRRDGRSMAGALYLCDGQTLYGRYWGCEEQAAFLHFETCYYQGIELCIAEGLQRFDAGAQGEHKIRRGFEPILTRSLHWVADERFRPAIKRFCEEEAAYVQEYMAAARAHLPYRRGD